MTKQHTKSRWVSDVRRKRDGKIKENKVHFFEHGDRSTVVIAKQKEGLDKLYSFSFFLLFFLLFFPSLRSRLGSFSGRERESWLSRGNKMWVWMWEWNGVMLCEGGRAESGGIDGDEEWTEILRLRKNIANTHTYKTTFARQEQGSLYEQNNRQGKLKKRSYIILFLFSLHFRLRTRSIAFLSFFRYVNVPFRNVG